jgi:hypothetical protein
LIFIGGIHVNESHIFAGNNTSQGFFSYFDYVFNPEEANRIYILKGGPGVGKSSFMKKFAAKMLSKGYFIENVHCSNDNESLDGINIPELKISFVDGTAPHTIDPKIPGAADEIINLGLYLDNKKLEKYKNEIIQINKETSLLYQSAYRFLKGASLILDEINGIYDKLTDKMQFNILQKHVIDTIFLKDSTNSDDKQKKTEKTYINSIGNTCGKIRKLFSEAYTADGYIIHTNSLCYGKKVWAITGKNLDLASKLLDYIVNEAVNKGFDTECYCHPLNPEQFQHISIPALNLMIVSIEEQYSCKYDEIIDLSALINHEKLKAYHLELDSNTNIFDDLTKNAFKKLYEAKKLHELLEIFFINSMDFKSVNECFDHILSKYTNYAHK